MTFVVGVHLGDAVGVLGDTRVTVQYSSRIEYLDNALKVYHRPPLIIGLAGNAIASDLLATKFQREHLVPLSATEAYARSVNANWMISRLSNAYADALRERRVNQRDQFALVIAAENSLALAGGLASVGDFSGLLNATISSSARAVSRDECEPGQRLVFVMDFPSRNVDVARPAAVVMRGSGVISDSFLRTQHSALLGHHLTFGDRLASIARDMVRAAAGLNDPSFNAAVLGWARSRGYAESVLQGLTSWPKHSVPPESYVWEPLAEDDRIPRVSPYCVGSDLNDLELGWIFDVKRQRKLRLQSIAKAIGTMDAQ